MINLIPNQEKKRKINDFYFRLLVVFLFMLSFCFLVGIVAFLPAYVFSTINKGLVEKKLEIQETEEVPTIDQSALAMMEEINSKIGLIETAEKNKYLVSERVINEIISEKMSDIKILQINYDNTTLDGKKVSVRGIAPSRERLLVFRRSLENNTAFKKVDLPISNFVKGSNIEFYLNLIPS